MILGFKNMDAVIRDFMVNTLEQFSGPNITVGWTVYRSDVNPVHWLELRTHPEGDSSLTMTFFLQYRWIEIQEDSGIEGESIEPKIVLLDSSSWQTELVDNMLRWVNNETAT